MARAGVTAAATTVAVACAIAFFPPDWTFASGCFGGEPSVRPQDGAEGLPTNTLILITRRDAADVRWLDPEGQQVPMVQERIGRGRSAARVLRPQRQLAPGEYRLETTDPDRVYRFSVLGRRDRQPPHLTGGVALDAHFAPDRTSSCPTNIWIRMVLPTPIDDLTELDGFSYLVRLAGVGRSDAPETEMLVHAESVSEKRVLLRIGETGCGCIPYASLETGHTYRVGISAIDAAGNTSPQWLWGEVTIP